MGAKIKGPTLPEQIDNLGRNQTQSVCRHAITIEMDRMTIRVWEATVKTSGKTGTKWSLGRTELTWGSSWKGKRIGDRSTHQQRRGSSTTDKGRGTRWGSTN